MRLEKDGLGTMNVPDEAYYGIVTLRSMLAYDIGPRTLSDYFPYIRAVTLSKIASAKANMQIGMLSKEYGEAILKASQEILDGKFTDQFPVNIYRGPSTPINMNVNEVIAHRANEILTGNKEGPIKPNNHVNMSQSTGDVQPTAKLILIYELISSLEDPIRSLLRELQHKSEENKKTIKMGRTLAQDALPVTYGMTFKAYAGAIERCLERLENEKHNWNVSCLGGTAIGTGMGALPGYRKAARQALEEVLGRPIKLSENLPDNMGATDDWLLAHAKLEALALVLWRIGRDLLFLSSAPSGLREIRLSTDGDPFEQERIPVPEMIIQACEKVLANHTSMVMGLQSGWLEMGPLSGIPYKVIIESSDLLRSTLHVLSFTIKTLSIDKEHCFEQTEKSTSLATMVSTLFGYEIGTKVAHFAMDNNLTCKEATKQLKLLPDEVVEDLFDVHNLVDMDKLEELFGKYQSYRKV